MGAFLLMLPPSPPTPAPALAFDFKDPKEISAVSLTLDSPLEPIVGYAKGISGTLNFDPARPEAASGTISVDADSVLFANEGYTATARGYALDSKRWPRLTLAIRKVERVKKISATRYSGVILADFTCRGITKPKRLVATADFLPGRAEERTGGKIKGDLLVVRTRFSVSRKEHGISDGIPDALVGDNIEVGVAVVGIRYAPTSAATPPAVPRLALRARENPLAKPLAPVGGGKALSLGEIAAGRPLVVFFLNEECGVTIYYKDRLRRLAADCAAKGIAFAAVHTGRRLHPERALELPERAYLRIPFLNDADGALMRSFGIGQSMVFALVGKDGKTAYLGGLDDAVDPKQVKRTPLRDAIADVLAARPVRTPRFRALGCAILPLDG